jgi:hypothetical protein
MTRNEYVRADDVFSTKTLEICHRELRANGRSCATVRFRNPRSVRGAAMPIRMRAVRAVIQAKLDGASFTEAGIAAQPYLGVRVTRQTASVWFRRYADAVRESNDILITATTEEQ